MTATLDSRRRRESLRNARPISTSGSHGQPFDVPLIDLDTGEVLDRALVGTLDLAERDAEDGLTVCAKARS